MKNFNQIEIILFSKYSLKDLRQKQLANWLGTTAQSAIHCQQKLAKKVFLTALKGSPAIYMS